MGEKKEKYTLFIIKLGKSKTILPYKNKFPRTFHFLAQRLSINKFNGLPLSIFLIAIFFNLLLIFDFTEDIINSKKFIVIDNFLAQLVFSFRNEQLAKFFYLISLTCNIMTVILLGFGISIYLLLKKKFHFVIGLLIAISGSGLTIYLGKSIFKIGRPIEYSYYLENNYSFPSGHSTIVVSFYGLLFYFLLRNNYSLAIKTMFIFFALLFFFLIGFSRLYLGVHFLSDVIAGYILGFLWLLVSICTIEWLKYK